MILFNLKGVFECSLVLDTSLECFRHVNIGILDCILFCWYLSFAVIFLKVLETFVTRFTQWVAVCQSLFFAAFWVYDFLLPVDPLLYVWFLLLSLAKVHLIWFRLLFLSWMEMSCFSLDTIFSLEVSLFHSELTLKSTFPSSTC